MGNKHDFCSFGKYNVQKSKKQKNKKSRPIDDEFSCDFESSRRKKRKSSNRFSNDKSPSSSCNVSLRSRAPSKLLNDAFESPYVRKHYCDRNDSPKLTTPTKNLDFQTSSNLFPEVACKIDRKKTSACNPAELTSRDNTSMRSSLDQLSEETFENDLDMNLELPFRSADSPKDELEIPEDRDWSEACNPDTLTSRDNNSVRSSLDPISEDKCDNVLDKTLFRPTNVPKGEMEIPEDREWSEEFDPYFDINEQLQKQPEKSSLRTKPRSILSRPVNTYKYFDEEDNLKYVVGGYSHSTYIRRLIVYIESLILSMDFIIMKGFIPGVNYEANLFGNIQSINDLFRDELMPMLIYSVYNTKKNNYYGELKKSLQKAIQQFLSYSTSPSLNYKFREQKQFFYFSDEPDKDTKFVTSVRRNEYSKLAENLFLFISTILQAVFLKRIHYRVLQGMFQFLKEELHRAATNVLITEDD